jgi:hypothetical protein
MNAEQKIDQWGQIVAKAWQDDAFKKRLLQPSAAIKEEESNCRQASFASSKIPTPPDRAASHSIANSDDELAARRREVGKPKALIGNCHRSNRFSSNLPKRQAPNPYDTISRPPRDLYCDQASRSIDSFSPSAADFS